MWLWNAILPDVTGVRRISFWQATGLLALCRILVGGFGGKPGPRRFGPPMSDDARRRWHTMNGEEREQFRKGLQAIVRNGTYDRIQRKWQ